MAVASRVAIVAAPSQHPASWRARVRHRPFFGRAAPFSSRAVAGRRATRVTSRATCPPRTRAAPRGSSGGGPQEGGAGGGRPRRMLAPGAVEIPPDEVEEALKAQLRPAKRNWLRDIGKSRVQATAAGEPCLLIKRHIRQYEDISHPGSIVVYGDVNAGASVRAGGDVIVLGRLAGRAGAGLGGDTRAVVFALAMEPAAIAIADEVVAGPDGATQPYAEVASISAAGTISIEPALGTERQPQAGPEDRRVGGAGADPIMQYLAKKHLVSVKWAVEGGGGGGGGRPNPHRAARVALFTALYISVAGLAVIAAPVTVFGLLFDVRAISPGWIRVFGVLCLMFGFYYWGAAQGDLLGIGAHGFYLSTILGRTVLFFSFCALVASGAVQMSLLVLGVANLLGALSMLSALRS